MASDMTPSTGTFGTADLIVGTETAVEVWANQIAQNTGWLRYRPLYLHHLGTDNEVTAEDGTTSTRTEYVYLETGTYDVWYNATLSTAQGATGTIALNGTVIYTGGTSETGSLLDVAMATDAWVTVAYSVVAGAGGTSQGTVQTAYLDYRMQ